MAQPASEPEEQSSAELLAEEELLELAARAQLDGLLGAVSPLRQVAPDVMAELGELEQRRFAASQ